ncbi:MAG: 2-phospho-L-lactate guanylyltransferase [Actinomycetia bacterium]|nr:2-phospho-L-lactate guanylyltransferase [Actinomycetes bacterium]
MGDPVALVPIRSFNGMTRLASVLDPQKRSDLARMLASRVLDAVSAAGLETIVVTSSDDVARWARGNKASVHKDPRTGLSDAINSCVSAVGSAPWLVIHADLPLVTPLAIATVARASRSAMVIVPSYDGGTTVIAGNGTFPFAYGIGSFQRHYATAPHATIIVSPELSADIDTELGLELVPELLDTGFRNADKAPASPFQGGQQRDVVPMQGDPRFGAQSGVDAVGFALSPSLEDSLVPLERGTSDSDG